MYINSNLKKTYNYFLIEQIAIKSLIPYHCKLIQYTKPIHTHKQVNKIEHYAQKIKIYLHFVHELTKRNHVCPTLKYNIHFIYKIFILNILTNHLSYHQHAWTIDCYTKNNKHTLL